MVGSGIRGVSQFTLEAVMHIERADKVLYCVCDAASEGFIKRKNKNAIDLYEYYSDAHERADSFVQMAEVSDFSDFRLTPYFYGSALTY